MAKGSLCQVYRRENVQNTKRVPPTHSFLATLARPGQEQCDKLLNFDICHTTSIAYERSRSKYTRSRSNLRAYDVNEQTIVPLHVIRITCLSRYFPESVCTAVYGVGYSLSLYYFTLGYMCCARHDKFVRKELILKSMPKFEIRIC